ncbi:hypothetical protein NQZ68_003506 [Dissostichus eleginoides]|nr:hypothetical protein NQZ68_003506 [Dissostichus eleginoides]
MIPCEDPISGSSYHTELSLRPLSEPDGAGVKRILPFIDDKCRALLEPPELLCDATQIRTVDRALSQPELTVRSAALI